MADDVFETVRTVLAVREYKDQPVPEALVRRIVEAGRLTASSMNGQPWHFVVVQQAQRLRELGALVRTGPYISGAPLAIVVGYDSESRFGVSDASRAIQSMILTAWSEGVGSNWTGFNNLEEVRRWCRLPDSYTVLAVLPFGYPSHSVGKGKKNRKPLSEIASLENFGAPFS
ncbi:MAG: nitroreductase family protein [Candidatus Dormiibacterota bacterium]|jgi:nitroreductase